MHVDRARFRPLRPAAFCSVLSALLLLPALGIAQDAPQVGYAGVTNVLASQAAGSTAFTPYATVLDQSGNVYVSDLGNQQVLKFPRSGSGFGFATPIVVANETTIGHIFAPVGLAVDASGDVFVSDAKSNTVFEIPLTISGYTGHSALVSVATVSSIGAKFQPQGLAFDSAGNLFIADQGDSQILEIPPASGGAQGSVTQAIQASAAGANFSPVGVALDPCGNLYVSSSTNSAATNQVVEFATEKPTAPCPQSTSSGTGYYPPQVLASAASTGLPGFTPVALAIDGSGSLYVSDAGDSAVIRIPWTGTAFGQESVVVDIARQDAAFVPAGVAAGGSGNLYLADEGNHQFSQIEFGAAHFGDSSIGTAGASILVPFVFNVAATLNSATPVQIAPEPPSGSPQDYVVVPGASDACTAASYPAGSVCNVLIQFTPRQAGVRPGVVRLYDGQGSILARAFLSGVGVGPLVSFGPGNAMSSPSLSSAALTAAVVDGAGNLYLAESDLQQVVKLTWTNGSYSAPVVVAGTTQFGSGFLPTGLALDGAGDLLIADFNNAQVVELPWTGSSFSSPVVVTTSAENGGSTFGPYDLAIDSHQNLYIADTGNQRISKLLRLQNSWSSPVTVVDSNSMGSGFYPAGVAVDAGGDVFVADWESDQKVVEIPWAGNTYGSAVTVADASSAGGTFFPRRVAVDAAGDVFIADTGTPQILKVSNLAGQFQTPSVLKIPSGSVDAQALALDPLGNLLLADKNKKSAIRVDYADAPILNFTAAAPGSTESNSVQTLMVSNAGNAPLLVPAPASGSNPATSDQFSLSGSSTCPSSNAGTLPGSLAAGAACSYVLGFNPASGDTGTASGTLTITDNNLNASAPNYTSQQVGLSGGVVTLAIVPAQLPQGTIGASYSEAITGTGGTAPYVATLVSGSLPAGLRWNASTGTIGGTPTAAGQYPIVLAVSDANNVVYSQSFTLTINGPVQITTTSLPYGIVGTAYSQNIAVSGGQAPYTFALASNSKMPAGLSLSAQGQITGTPTTAGSTSLSITVTDAASAQSTQALSIAVYNPVSIAPIATLTGTVGAAFSQSFTASGGIGSTYTFAVSAGKLPPGLTLNAAGSLAGTPSASGSYPFTITATDSSENTGSQSFTVKIGPPTLVLSPAAAALPDAVYGTAVAQNFSASGGTPPYTYSLAGGTSLPAGLSLNAQGQLTGMPAVPGSFTFTIQATDSSTGSGPYSVAQAYSLNVNKATATLTLNGLAQTYTGSPLPVTATTTPAGLQVSFTYNGSPQAPSAIGTYAVLATVTDNSYQGTAAGSLVISAASLVVSAKDASRAYGAPNPAFTGSVTGASAGDQFAETFNCAANATSPVGTYPIVPAVTGTNLGNYTLTKANGTLTVTQAPTTIAVTASSQTVNPGASVTFNAQVASLTTGTPTGTVSFYDGSTLLGTATLNAGAGSFTTAALTANSTHSITASYSGDTNFQLSTLTQAIPIAVTALDFSITPPASTTATVAPGASVSYGFAVAPLYGSYAGPVTFTATGLPSGAAVTFSPATIAVTDGKKLVTMVVTVANTTASADHRPLDKGAATTALALLLFPFAGLGALRKSRKTFVKLMVLAALGSGLLTGLSGCGGSPSGLFNQTAKSYTVTVTATGGGITHSTNVTLDVE